MKRWFFVTPLAGVPSLATGRRWSDSLHSDEGVGRIAPPPCSKWSEITHPPGGVWLNFFVRREAWDAARKGWVSRGSPAASRPVGFHVPFTRARGSRVNRIPSSTKIPPDGTLPRTSGGPWRRGPRVDRRHRLQRHLPVDHEGAHLPRGDGSRLSGLSG